MTRVRRYTKSGTPQYPITVMRKPLTSFQGLATYGGHHHTGHLVTQPPRLTAGINSCYTSDCAPGTSLADCVSGQYACSAIEVRLKTYSRKMQGLMRHSEEFLAQ